jgi:hypothetical protein
MASLMDVLNVLTQNVTNAVYPNGTGNPSTAGIDVTIISGWPIREKVDQILLSGNALINVFPTHKVKIVTKFERVYQAVTIIPATLTATVIDETVTIGGTVSTPQAVTIIYNGTGYSYQVLISDTLDSIATALAALIPGATAIGPVITTVGAYQLIGRIATSATAAYELSRQDRVFLIRFWTTDPAVRDNLINPVDVYFKKNYRIVLPDGFYGITWPMEAPDPYMDDWEKSLMLIGNLEYKVQYPTTSTDIFTTITDTIQNVEIVNEIT